MATHTIGTAANNTLTCVVWNGDAGVLLPADLQTINNGILDDQNARHPVASVSGIGGFVREGFLYVPNRGKLMLLKGDVVAIDPTAGIGWPILVSKDAAAAAGWVFV